VVKRLEGYGLVNVKEEPWGTFWPELELFTLRRPYARAAVRSADRISAGLDFGHNGMKEGEAVLAPLNSEADFEKYKGKLRARWCSP